MRFKDRHTYLGASEVGQACGLSQYGTVHDLWMEKTLRAPRVRETPIMERGHMMEPMIDHILLTRYGAQIDSQQQEISRPETPWLRSHIDGVMPFVDVGGGTFILEPGGAAEFKGNGVVEKKAPGSNMIRKIKREGFPSDYIAQLQVNIHNANAEWGVLLLLDYDNWDVLAAYMKRDTEVCEALLLKAAGFWRMVKEDVEPVVEKEPARITGWEHITNGGPVVLATDEARDLALRYALAEGELNKAQEAMEKAKEDLIEAVKDKGRALKVQVPVLPLSQVAHIGTSVIQGRETYKGKELHDWTAALSLAITGGEDEVAMDMARVFLAKKLFVSTGQPYTRTTIKFKEMSNDE